MTDTTKPLEGSSPLDPATLTLLYRHGGSDAAVYHDGSLLMCGHTDDVHERLIDRLGMTVFYDRDFITDKEALGWSGAAQRLADIP